MVNLHDFSNSRHTADEATKRADEFQAGLEFENVVNLWYNICEGMWEDYVWDALGMGEDYEIYS